MKLNPAERAQLQAAWQSMGPADKARYIFTYYKWPILLAVLAAVILASTVHHELTKKTPLLYLGLVNTAVGDDMLAVLDTGFVAAQPDAPARAEVYTYTGLYFTSNAADSDHEYAYASRLKILATITDEKLDLVLMNREAYDLLSQSGWLAALPELLPAGSPLADTLAPYLTENTVILQDNAIEFELGEAEEYRADTVQAVNGISAAGLPRLAAAGFDGEVFVGVIGNTPRPETVRDYLAYLAMA